MLDEAYQSETDAALIDLAQRPIPRKPQAPSFSMWATTKAAPKGVVAGAAEGLGSSADIIGAFGQVAAATDARPGGMFSVPDNPDEEAAARKKMLEGIDYSSEPGRMFRDSAKYYMPDPATAHAAEQAVGSLFRVGSKALTSAALLGNVPGAVVAGLEEGFTQSEELRNQGVDLATRTKVGAVTAATNAFGFALPVAGTTWKATAGLAIAGGPATFIGQNTATRKILADANYSHLSNQYDPFDPAGLALSTLLPLGFGAMAMRGRGKTLSTPKVDQESVDAAHVDLLREQVDANRATPPEDLQGAAQHTQAMTKALDQLADGGRVEVSDIAPAAARITEEVDARLAPIVKAMEEEVKLRPDESTAVGPGGMREPLTARIQTEGGVPLVIQREVRGKYVVRSESGDQLGSFAYAEAPSGGFRVSRIEVAPASRRQGVASAVYDFIENQVIGQKLKESNTQSPEGAAFRAGRSEKQQAAASKKTQVVEADPVKAAKRKMVDDTIAKKPDLMTRMDGMDEPLKASEVLARVREEAAAEAADASLIEAAAECFLSTFGG